MNYRWIRAFQVLAVSLAIMRATGAVSAQQAGSINNGEDYGIIW
jgi:hypothetical protein